VLADKDPHFHRGNFLQRHPGVSLEELSDVAASLLWVFAGRARMLACHHTGEVQAPTARAAEVTSRGEPTHAKSM